MNKKGFTVIELIVSFSLTTIVILLLFQMLLTLRDFYVESAFKSQLANRQALLSSKINNDFKNKEIKIALKCGDYCLTFIFEDNTSKKLIVDNQNNIFTYGDYSTKLIDGSSFGDFYVRNEKIMGLPSNADLDSFIEINIPIFHPLLEEDFGINILYQYDSNSSAIADITFTTDLSTEDRVILKGTSLMYHPNDQTWTDPGYYVVRSDGTVTDMDASVVVSGTVGSTINNTYSVTYTLGSDIKTRQVTILQANYNYDYTGSPQAFTSPVNGVYQVELWGAEGAGTAPGKGSYVKGNVHLPKDSIYYLYVGQRNSVANVSSYNGGTGSSGGYPGGGATDMRLLNGAWDNADGLRNRIMVAGGGGSGNTANAGGGGTLIGLSGGLSTGGAQTFGGTASGGFTNGTFGIGGTGCGGGGGYYGGGGATCATNGAGGSSFISGYPGVNAIDASGSHTNQSIHFSDISFSSYEMLSGVQTMPNPRAAGTIIGNTGNGYAKIKLMTVIN
jgi:type II secretory pathway pseudopilin PulG